MSVIVIIAAVVVITAVSFRLYRAVPAASTPPCPATVVAHSVVTNLRVCIHPQTVPCSCKLGSRARRIDKDIYLHRHPSRQQAWLYIELTNETELANEDLVVTDITIGERPRDPVPDTVLEELSGKIWLSKKEFRKQINQAVTGVDIFYGEDAVDPRPQWTLLQSPLYLDAHPEIPVARLSIQRGKAEPKPHARKTLRVPENGTFKIMQISDLHMTTGVGVCNDAMDSDRESLSARTADPLTVDFMGKMLDRVEPNMVVVTGDQVHHDVDDSQTALFKAVAPIEARRIPYATVFGNHDSEGAHAQSRMEQMSDLQGLHYCLSEPGPGEIDGVGNYFLQVLAADPSEFPVLTLYFLDSHGAIPNLLGKLLRVFRNGYDHIKRSQIEWFLRTSEAQRRKCEQTNYDDSFFLSLAFFHIPLPEFKDCDSSIRIGTRREPTEGPIHNSHFYEALAKQGIAAIGVGHDHLNDFVAQLPPRLEQGGSSNIPGRSPWLCHGGSAGFGAYGNYGGKRVYRRARVWEINVKTRSLTTWICREYCADKVDEIVLVGDEAVGNLLEQVDEGRGSVVH